MQGKWSAQEVLKIASKVELHGQSLYASLESKTGDEKLKSMWNFLKSPECLKLSLILAVCGLLIF